MTVSRKRPHFLEFDKILIKVFFLYDIVFRLKKKKSLKKSKRNLVQLYLDLMMKTDESARPKS